MIFDRSPGAAATHRGNAGLNDFHPVGMTGHPGNPRWKRSSPGIFTA
jgi:hypothetical protein